MSDDTSSFHLTQATIISEPYFDAQTPRNVTGLVGKSAIDIRDNLPMLRVRHVDVQKASKAPRRVNDSVFLHLGKSAYLSCRVRSLGNKTVSWIRHRDIHILTVGSYTYTSDQRFQATHHKENDEWTLQIKWAQKRDGGGDLINFPRLSQFRCVIGSDWKFSHFSFLSFLSFQLLLVDSLRMSNLDATCSQLFR